jgi:hypothetical protein
MVAQVNHTSGEENSTPNEPPLNYENLDSTRYGGGIRM